MEARHIVVVLAYQQSPHLDQCLASLTAQGLHGDELICCTSTPSAFIAAVCEKYKVPIMINDNGGSIGRDWNFGLRQGSGEWITLAHQDDIYLPGYISHIRQAITDNPDAILILPWFREYADGAVRKMNLTHGIKRLLFLNAFRWKDNIGSQAKKLRLLSWGNPISCGGVALNRKKYKTEFNEALQFTLDWMAWLNAARTGGDFVFIREPLMYRRIHSASATSVCIDSGRRSVEELQAFCTLWPAWFARILAKIYRISYFSNQTKA
jgi:glycosyltransferase involved in cell wall biosynthesis